jgi:hypothetical protein
MRRAGHASPVAALCYQHATEDRDKELADALAALVLEYRCGPSSAAPRMMVYSAR